MNLTKRQERILEFVKDLHGDQKRKYTGEPYWHHLLNVAKIVSEHSVTMGVEIALCHDLIEDTPCSMGFLWEFLFHDCEYDYNECTIICHDVFALSDQYTFAKYPHLNRLQRKELEAMRLIQISPNAQSVKYADIIDNTSSIVQHDPNFAKVYLIEIGKKIYQMNKGDSSLYQKCLYVYENACEKLKS